MNHNLGWNLETLTPTKRRFIDFVSGHATPREVAPRMAEFYDSEAFGHYRIRESYNRPADTMRVSSAVFVDSEGRTDTVSLLRGEAVVLRIIHHLGRGAFAAGSFDFQIQERDPKVVEDEVVISKLLDTLEAFDRDHLLDRYY